MQLPSSPPCWGENHCNQPRCNGLANELSGHCRRPNCCSRCFAAVARLLPQTCAHVTVHPAICESHLCPALATLHRTMLTIPFPYRRRNHLEHLVRQGCHGKLLFVPLSDSTLFLVVSRPRQPRDWNASSRSSTPRPVEIIAARASIPLVASGIFPSPSISHSRGLAGLPYPQPATLSDLEQFRHLSRDTRC